MDRRDFLQGVAAAAGAEILHRPLTASSNPQTKRAGKGTTHTPVSVDGCTLVAEFRSADTTWKVHEDLRTRDGSMIFVSSTGESRGLTRNSEAAMAQGTPYVGLALNDIGLSSADLLADRLLKDGDPDPEMVKSAAPPMASAEKNPSTWTTFVGTKEAYDVTPVYHSGNTGTSGKPIGIEQAPTRWGGRLILFEPEINRQRRLLSRSSCADKEHRRRSISSYG